MNAGMQAMQARMAAMTPEQRKAMSEKALAAKQAKRAARQAGVVGPQPEKQTATVKARVAPTVEREYAVCLLTGPDTVAWVSVKAGGLQRAKRTARKAHPGKACLGVVEAVLRGQSIG